MKRLILCFALLMVPMHLAALSTQDLLSLVAMPLAVAAVSDVSGVPQDQLADIVSTLNQANVPPDQFVEVVRYVPVTFGQPQVTPTLTEFVQTQTANGITGPALVTSITRRLQTTYNVTPSLVMTEPATTFVVENDFIPTTTLIGSNPFDLVALPLAVAAVSDIAGIPQNQLADLVSTLNNANMPVAQEIQVIRFAPVALTVDNGQPFVNFVQTQVSQGITGPALVPVVAQQLQTFVPQQQVVLAPPRAREEVDDEELIRPVTVMPASRNPHGGPPGLIKKELGLQTGAEVVHGGKRGRQFTPAPLQVPPPMISSSPAPPGRVEREHGRGEGHEHGEGHGNGRGHGRENVQVVQPSVVAPPVVVQQPAAAPAMVPPGRGEGHGEGGEGKGGGKGHGKDH